MNRIEDMLLSYEKQKRGGIIVEVPMLRPIPQTQLNAVSLLIQAGIDVIQIPIPVRYPWMYGKRILKIQKSAAENNIDFNHSFEVLKELVEKYPKQIFMPVGFYGGLQKMGQKNYITKCKEIGIGIVDVPDYPLVHDNDPFCFYDNLKANNISYVTVISTDLALQPENSHTYNHLVSLLKKSYGFCFLLAAKGGKTGEKSEFQYDELKRAKERILAVQEKIDRRCPIVAVCGISTPEQVRIMVKELGLHVMFGSALFTRMVNGESNEQILRFLQDMKAATI